MKTIVLEPTTNTHRVAASSITKVDQKGGTVTLNIKGEGIVTHGEIVTESEHVIKYEQKEFNPVT